MGDVREARGGWGRFHRVLYRLGYAALEWRPRRRRALPPATVPGEPPALWVAWGRLGDTILQSGLVRALPTILGRPVVALGRSETEPLVAPAVQAFVGFDARTLRRRGARRRLLERLLEHAPGFGPVVCDLHLFHGGLAALGPVLERLPAEVRFVYEGYAPRTVIAPVRCWPRGCEVVPSLPKPHRSTDPEEVHVWNDLRHYARAVAARLGRSRVLDTLDLRPRPVARAPDHRTRRALGLPRDYVAVQVASDNPRKDWPLASWRTLLGSRTDPPFVLLGRAQGAPLEGPAVVDLRGRTDLTTCLSVIAGARAFVGPDSGLTHAAATLSVPAVCIAQSANLGWFFPYPRALVDQPPAVVRDVRHASCAGCGSMCELEPLWRSRRAGAPCVRGIDPTAVLAALERRLAPALPSPARSPV